MQTNTFWPNFWWIKSWQWPWKLDQGHQNLFSFLSCPNVISMQIWLKSASWFMRYCAQKHLLAQIWQFVLHWPWKIGRHQNQISSSSCSDVISMQIWLNSANQFMRYGAHKHLWTYGSLSPAVTLKIRSRSSKPNQLFIMSQCYIQAN